LLTPHSGASMTALIDRLGIPSAFVSLLAVPPLLTGALAGLVFRGLWEQRGWARMAAIFFTFLLALAAVAMLAFLIAFNFGDTLTVAVVGGVLALSALSCFYLLAARPSDELAVGESVLDQEMPEEVNRVESPTSPAYIEQAPSQVPPRYVPKESVVSMPHDWVPPPPRKPVAWSQSQAAATIASSPASSVDSTQQLPPTKSGTVEQPFARFTIRQGPDLGRQLSLYPEDTVTVGRDKARVDFVVSDPAVSGRHAQFRQAQGRIAVIDLGSTNGTFINGQRISQQTLADGDEIRMGATLMLFTLLNS